jgi:hypothetical protein
VSGVYALATTSDNTLSVDFLRTRVANHTWAGVYSDGAAITIQDSSIEGNTSPWVGGGVSVHNFGDPNAGGAEGSTRIINSTISANNSDAGGGGVYHVGGGNSRITDSTVSWNTATGPGGGLWLAAIDDYMVISGTTVAFNAASDTGGCAYAPTEKNYFVASICGNNTAFEKPDWDGITADSTNSLISNSWGFFPNGGSGTLLDVDPMLESSLLDNGGPYHTRVHRLLPGSPAIDHWESSGGTDQRYFARCLEADSTTGLDVCDIGAYEHDPGWLEVESLAVAAKSSDTHVNVTDNGYSTTLARNLQSNAANDFVTYTVPVFQTGTYNVKVKVRKNNNRGKFQLAVSSNPTGPWTNIGSVQDLYNPSSSFVELNVSNSASLSAGTRYFRFFVTGKNAASFGYQLFLDYIKLTKL